MAYRPGYKPKQSPAFIDSILKQSFQRFHIIDNPRNRRYIQDDIDAEFGGVFTVNNIAAVISSGNLPLEFESQQPPKRVIRADVPEIRRVMVEIKKKFPWLADTGEAGNRNLSKIFSWLQDNDAVGFTLETVKVAVEVLLPELESDRDYVPPQPPPPPAPPKPPAEQLESWQIPLNPTPSKQQLRAASSEAIKHYLKRLRESHQK